MSGAHRGSASDVEWAVRWLVAGRVQGVGFRWFVSESAQREGLRGDVRNLPDGRVEVRAIGGRRALHRLAGELRRGPRSARVDDVAESPLENAPAFEGFTVRH